MRDRSRIATKEDWEISPMPEKSTVFTINRRFTDEETEKLKPQQNYERHTMTDNIYFVRNYRKVGISDDEAISRCLSDCASAESRTVVFDGRDYLIGNAILLQSDTTVIIDGCTIRQADEAFDNVFRGDNLTVNPDDPYGLPIACREIRNIRILGKNGATVRGPEKNRVGYHPVLNENQSMTGDFWGWRTLTVSLSGRLPLIFGPMPQKAVSYVTTNGCFLTGNSA